MIISKFVLIADSQRTGWWTALGVALMAVGVAVIALLADTVPLVAFLTALPPLCAGAAALGRGDGVERKRTERAAMIAQIERELDNG